MIVRFALLLFLIAPVAWSAEKDLVRVQVTSAPSGAEASMRSGQSCFTPCFLRLSRKNESLIIMSKLGFRTAEINFKPTRKNKKLHVPLLPRAATELTLNRFSSLKGNIWQTNEFIDNLRLPRGMPSPDDIAVIIGNYNYLHTDLPNVYPARNDAMVMRRYVLETLGVKPENVIYRENATYANLITLFGNASASASKLGNSIKPGVSRVFVYYSGHGASNGSSTFLVPVDAEPSYLESVGYPLDWLYDNLSRLEVTERTLILESCFSGSSHAGPLIKHASPVEIRYRVSTVPDNINAMTATSKTQVASWDPASGLSLFTKYFLLARGGLADQLPHGNRDGDVSSEELKQYVEDNVKTEALRLYDRMQLPQFVFVSD